MQHIRVEISDVDNVAGVLQAENLVVVAEAYDVSVDLTFPKHGDGGFDYEVLRVFEERALTCALKNKGKYEINYKFSVDREVLKQHLPGVSDDAFLVTPPSGILHPNDKLVTIKVIFRSRKEVSFKELPLIRCEVVEPHMSETIANIPINVSARSVFSKYAISLSDRLSFESLVIGSGRRTREFHLENKGEFEFRYAISKASAQQTSNAVVKNDTSAKSKAAVKSVKGESSATLTPTVKFGRATMHKTSETVTSTPAPLTAAYTTGQRLTLGCFTVSPISGSVPAGGSQKIVVEVDPVAPGKEEQYILIEVDQRAPTDHPNGHVFGFVVDNCSPGIVTNDIYSIFTNCAIQTMSSSYISKPTYVIEENEVNFGAVVVGQTAKMQVRIANCEKVPCEVHFSQRSREKSTPGVSKLRPGLVVDGFSIEPAFMVIPAHDYQFATISFTPTAMQSFYSSFEATVVGGVDPFTNFLCFELGGEGSLPHVTLVKPTTRSPDGMYSLMFQRTLAGKTRLSSVILKNDGPIPAAVNIEVVPVASRRPMSSRLSRPGSAHRNQGKDVKTPAKVVKKGIAATRDDSKARFDDEQSEEAAAVADDPSFAIVDGGRSIIPPFTSHTFHINFMPKEARMYLSQVRINVEDNEFESSYVQVSGEGFADDLCIEGLLSVNNDLLDFGDSPLDESKSIHFTLCNNSNDLIKYALPYLPHITFQPCAGHIKPFCNHDITATFTPKAPVSVKEQAFAWSWVKIKYDHEYTDTWNDALKTVRWDINETISGRLIKVKVVEAVPEPLHTDVPDTSKQSELRYSCVSDFANFECSVTTIPFKETLLFQTRSFSFPMKNRGAAYFHYKWNLTFDVEQPSPDDIDDAELRKHIEELTALAKQTLFSIEPREGNIAPNETVNFTVAFSPVDVGNFTGLLQCHIENIESSMSLPSIDLSGTSQRPYCHLDLPDSDYLSSGRRRADGTSLPAQLDPNTRIIEFDSRGVRVANIKKFFVYNPTNIEYTFSWSCQSISASMQMMQPNVNGPFTCLTPEGRIQGGRKYEMSFEFVPTTLELAESLWTFSINSFDISIPFLLVGHSQEPDVAFDRAFLLLSPTLVNHTIKETICLVNNESTPISFAFNEKQISSINNVTAALVLSPAHGTIAAGEKIAFDVIFTPKNPQPFDVLLRCDVRKKSTPLILRLQTDAYIVKAAIQSIPSGPVIQGVAALNPDVPYPALDFGAVRLREKAQRFVTVQNLGAYPMEYVWTVESDVKKSLSHIVLQHPSGIVVAQDQVACEIDFLPVKVCNLAGINIVCTVTNGPRFVIPLTGSGTLPQIELSFDKYDFGKIFVHRLGMPVNQTVLVMVNNAQEELPVSCLFQSSDICQVHFSNTVLAPKGKVEIPISFTPAAPINYKETISFSVNGLNAFSVEVLATGVPLKVQLERTSQKIVNIGALNIGQTAKRTVSLSNLSVLPVPFKLNWDDARLQTHALTVSTDTAVIPPKSSVPITVLFNPTARIVPFIDEVGIEYLGQAHPLFSVEGSCHGILIELDHSEVQFGSVVVSNQVKRKVLLSNTGDIGTRFQWDFSPAKEFFDIAPVQGYVPPGSDLALTVSFTPKRVIPDIRFEQLRCEIEGGAPLLLTVSGGGVSQQVERDIIQFSTPVRHTEIKTIKIQNTSSEAWFLRPIYDNDCFSGHPTVIVQAGQTVPYEISFLPLTMSQSVQTGKDKKTEELRPHTGTLFIPCPDGSALLYNLNGVALPPKPAGVIQREVPCKVWYSESLSVTNWLKKPQRFHVIFNKTRVEQSTTIKVCAC